MPTEERKVINCPECGRKPIFGAEFCPYCGTKLDSEEERNLCMPAQTEELPDPDSLEGPCSVLLCGAAPLDIPRAGRVVAQEIKRPLPDVTREMKVSRGIIARALGAGTARSLARRLKELGIETIIVPQRKMDDFPPLLRIKSVAIGPEGMSCEAYKWDSNEEAHPSWTDIMFVSCGKIVISEVQEIENPDPEKKKTRVPMLETIIRREYVMDIFCREPWLRLRLDENTSGYALVEIGSFTGGKSGFYRMARRIMRYAPDLPVNAGMRFLTENAPEDAWEELFFDDKREFDVYNNWLLQLARYGFPLPSED